MEVMMRRRSAALRRSNSSYVRRVEQTAMVVSAERESECFLSFSWRVGKESEVTDDEYWGNHHERLRSDLVGRRASRFWAAKASDLRCSARRRRGRHRGLSPRARR